MEVRYNFAFLQLQLYDVDWLLILERSNLIFSGMICSGLISSAYCYIAVKLLFKYCCSEAHFSMYVIEIKYTSILIPTLALTLELP